MNFPFTAIVGQEKMKLALILNAINPKIGGVLLRGDKGTGKSTAVRSLVDVLPEIEVMDCVFNCSPESPCEECRRKIESGNYVLIKKKMRIVELPLSATEDRVVGTLDIERALSEGIKAFQPGILAEANNNILYIDEVNLLEDHLVDTLLDVAASGWNVVEREGISVRHPSRFILIGSMNPEEGELRPQLLDRFGMVVDVKAIDDVELRTEIVVRVEEFSENPEEFCMRFAKDQEILKKRIAMAREILNEVVVPREVIRAVAKICSDLGIETHRAEIVTIRAARAHAAYNGRKEVTIEDVKSVLDLTLPHRLKSRPFEEPKVDYDKIERMLQDLSEGKEGDGEFFRGDQKTGVSEGRAPKIEFKTRSFAHRGRRVNSLSKNHGRYVDFCLEGESIAVDATLRAAALFGRRRPKKCDLRYKRFVGKVASSIALVVDASGSMASLRRMEIAKGVLLDLLKDAYVKKDRVSLIVFKDMKAEVVVPPTNSPHFAVKRLVDIPVGGKTPLSAGLIKALDVLKSEKRKKRIPVLVIITDGRANVALEGDIKTEILRVAESIRKEGIFTVVIDADDYVSIGFSRDIHRVTGGLYFRLRDLNEKIGSVIKSVTSIS